MSKGTRLTLSGLVVRYAAFAAVATLANLAAQRCVLFFGETHLHFAFAVACGTGAGLVVKYLLDKRWIFYDSSKDIQAYTRSFFLYTVMGGFTTIVFWGIETSFWLIWRDHLMREIGALIGLTVGYIIKYNLDKRFVFNRKDGPMAGEA